MKAKTTLGGTECSNLMATHLRNGCATEVLPLLLLLALPAAAQGQFDYYTMTDGTITIYGYTGPGGAVTIPGTIDSLPVTSIGENAFWGRTNLTSVTIPDSVTNIGDYAFTSCTSLTNVVIGNKVSSIGNLAFSHCTNLTGITIPGSITTIPYQAFSYCTSLTDVTILHGVSSILDEAFSDCTRLRSITIPGSVTNIWSSAFWDCTSLAAIRVDALNSAYSSLDGVLFDKSQRTLILYPQGKTGSYTIPKSVIEIGNSSFAYCISLTNITVPNSVTSIADYAFYYCTNLTDLTIPASVTSIGYDAF
jgi:hypothetical protein